MRFLTLTLYNGERCRINFDLVESYVKITNRTFENPGDCIGYTCVLPIGVKEEDAYIVEESPNEIDEMLLNVSLAKL